MNNAFNVHEARIMVVDDQPANVKLMEKTLEQEGYKNVITTTKPLDALELFKQQSFDLVLLDLNMPVMDGFQVMEELKKLQDNDTDFLPVIVLTAQIDRDSRLRALECGARDYLTKPFDRVELVTRLRNMLEVRLVHKSVKTQKELLEEKVKERTAELEKTQREVIERLGRAAEYRDNETGLHIVRMSQMSAALGAAAGMNVEDVELLLNASPMHDIGKIGIPDSILLKPGKLDANQWTIMQTHSAIGAEILSGDDSLLLKMAREIALTHHEKWNGKGYPNGLQGEAIPLVGRIVAIADVFDALTSERPYKKAWPVQEAVDLINSEKGEHFDPRLVDLFNEILPDFLAILSKHAEPPQAG